INLNNGNNLIGNNLTAKNNFVRGTGDDGLAIFSNNPGSGTNMDTVTLDHNTSIAPWWADGIRVAGGQNITVTNNYSADAVTNTGLVVGIFGAQGFPLVSATITDNVIERGGGGTYPYAVFFSGGGTSQTATATFARNNIVDALYYGFSAGNYGSATFGPGNVINAPGLNAIFVRSNTVSASGTYQNNAAINLPSGQTAFNNQAGANYAATLSGNSWQYSPPIADGTYVALARHSGLALDITHGWTANGSLLEQWGKNGGSNQSWTLNSLGGNVYRIIGLGSGRALEAPNASLTAGTVLDIYDWNEDGNQLWSIVQTDPGYYTVTNVNSGLVMEVSGGVGAVSPGAAVDQWNYGLQYNKQWSFVSP
ncbi:MAG TPA: RICIN domain-containing protein, partial [Candidatus Methylacidiphilales bacterium]